MTRAILTTAALAAVYALALASADPWDLVLGAILGGSIVAVFGGFMFTGEPHSVTTLARRAAHFPMFVLATIADIVRGTLVMVRVVFSRNPAQNTGFVEVPIGQRSESGLAVSGLANTLSPGTVVVEVDRGSGTWTVHSIDAKDEDALRAEIERFYQRYQRPFWP